jgi:hypothetical protein
MAAPAGTATPYYDVCARVAADLENALEVAIVYAAAIMVVLRVPNTCPGQPHRAFIALGHNEASLLTARESLTFACGKIAGISGRFHCAPLLASPQQSSSLQTALGLASRSPTSARGTASGRRNSKQLPRVIVGNVVTGAHGVEQHNQCGFASAGCPDHLLMRAHPGVRDAGDRRRRAATFAAGRRRGGHLYVGRS